MTETPPDPSVAEHPIDGTDETVATEADDTARAVRMTIAHVIYNRGLGHSLDTCESIADEIMHAVSDLEAL